MNRERIISLIKTWLPLCIILLGVALRLSLYLHNRCLWIDEASVARNIYERDFAGLTAPLHYYQYAPPAYLWVVKCFTVVFNYSEYALRLYSLLAGIASMVILYIILKKETGFGSLLYPIFLMATGFIYIQYSTELKQYMPDVLIATCLVWLALRTDIRQHSAGRFMLTGMVAGAVSIWSSMPSVFILSGIGAYYITICLKHRRSNLLLFTILTGLFWLINFAVYYLLILKPQINSDYLQNYHHRFFLFATPTAASEWQHNKDVLKSILTTAGGQAWYAILVNLLLLSTGIVTLLQKRSAKLLLYGIPIFAMLIAAALNHYSLIPRLTLFAMPLIYILISYGFKQLWNMNAWPVVIILCSMAVITAYRYQATDTFTHPYEAEEITRGLDFLKDKQVPGKDVFVAAGAEHAFIYYTRIHPQKERWTALANATLLIQNTGFDSLAQTIQDRKAFLYTIVFDSYDGKRKLDTVLQLTDSLHTEGCHVFVYEPR